MPHRPTLNDIADEETRIDIEGEIDLLVRHIAHALAPHAAYASVEEALAVPEGAATRADRLALLTAAEALRDAAAEQVDRRVSHLGATPAITYADVGAAVGITRQTARTRWPGVVEGARPGRPTRKATVYLAGGPACWDGKSVEVDQAMVLDRDLEEVGAYLVVDGQHMPADVPADARAHYAPDQDDDTHVWVFQGWVLS